jgi:hypothetical protein
MTSWRVVLSLRSKSAEENTPSPKRAHTTTTTQQQQHNNNNNNDNIIIIIIIINNSRSSSSNNNKNTSNIIVGLHAGPRGSSYTVVSMVDRPLLHKPRLRCLFWRVYQASDQTGRSLHVRVPIGGFCSTLY